MQIDFIELKNQASPFRNRKGEAMANQFQYSDHLSQIINKHEIEKVYHIFQVNDFSPGNATGITIL